MSRIPTRITRENIRLMQNSGNSSPVVPTGPIRSTHPASNNHNFHKQQYHEYNGHHSPSPSNGHSSSTTNSSNCSSPPNGQHSQRSQNGSFNHHGSNHYENNHNQGTITKKKAINRSNLPIVAGGVCAFQLDDDAQRQNDSDLDPASTKKQCEAFMMTGDLMIKLANHRTGEPLSSSVRRSTKSASSLRPSVTSVNYQQPNNHGSNSLPSSPSHDKHSHMQAMNDSDILHINHLNDHSVETNDIVPSTTAIVNSSECATSNNIVTAASSSIPIPRPTSLSGSNRRMIHKETQTHHAPSSAGHHHIQGKGQAAISSNNKHPEGDIFKFLPSARSSKISDAQHTAFCPNDQDHEGEADYVSDESSYSDHNNHKYHRVANHSTPSLSDRERYNPESNSLNTLINESQNFLASSSSSSSASSSSRNNTSSSSNFENFTSSMTRSGGRVKQQYSSTVAHTELINDEDDDEKDPLSPTDNDLTEGGLGGRLTASICSSASSQGTDTSLSIPTEAILSSCNGSPTKGTLATNTAVDQTESSMSEGYSVMSSLSGLAGGTHLSSVNQNQKSESQQQQGRHHSKHKSQHSAHRQGTFSLSPSSDSNDSSTPSICDERHNQFIHVSNFTNGHNHDPDENHSRYSNGMNGTTENKKSTHNTKHNSDQPQSTGKNPGKESSERGPQRRELKPPSPPPIPQCTSPASEEEVSDAESLKSFHHSPPKGVDIPSAVRLAKRLYELDGFKKSDVSRHLSKNNEFSRTVAENYLFNFDFIGDTLDVALRKFLNKFCLTGETQERERVLNHFAKRYLDCNPGAFRSQDATHTLTCALMILNTDLHGDNPGRRMTCSEFIDNLAELNENQNFPRDVLRALYQSIKTQPLRWATDEYENDMGQSSKQHSSSASSSSPKQIGAPGLLTRITGGPETNPFLDPPNLGTTKEYKKGWLVRKCCFDMGGKKTPFGRRGWKMFYATLRDLVLYLHKDENGFQNKTQLYDSLNNSIRIHHALAIEADYKKRQFVFQLQTADQAVYLFQTSGVRELESWVDTINLVAATLSAPQLPEGVGSCKKFQRPLLPSSITKLSPRDQLLDHENRLAKIDAELLEHSQKSPSKTASRRQMNEYFEKQRFMNYEKKRYLAYYEVMKSKLPHLLSEPPSSSSSSSASTSTSHTSTKSALKCPRSLIVHQGKPLSQTTIGEEEPNLDEDSGEDDEMATSDRLHDAVENDPNWRFEGAKGSATAS